MICNDGGEDYDLFVLFASAVGRLRTSKDVGRSLRPTIHFYIFWKTPDNMGMPDGFLDL